MKAFSYLKCLRYFKTDQNILKQFGKRDTSFVSHQRIVYCRELVHELRQGLWITAMQRERGKNLPYTKRVGMGGINFPLIQVGN